jgi:hypothetical protein
VSNSPVPAEAEPPATAAPPTGAPATGAPPPEAAGEAPAEGGGP